MNEVHVKNTGLRGVTVADTKISYIDGEQGILLYRGYRIEELADRSTFPEVAWLLLRDRLPDEEEIGVFAKQLRDAGEIPDFVLGCLKKLPKDALPMDVLQASVPLVAISDPQLSDDTREGNLRKAVSLMARIPALVAAWHRIRNGLDPLPQDNSLSHTGNFLWQLQGRKPDSELTRDLDICLILHADHTFNASTFACREVVSTRAHMYAGVAAGVGALSGSLHGGANERVMRMLSEVESEEDIPGWVASQLDQKKRIMGMGHAVYKAYDPRARILKEMSRRLGEKFGETKWYELSDQVERAALAEFEKRGKKALHTNVDFWSASVYHMIGIPADLMTGIFAISRIAGWCAHIIEEKFGDAQEKPVLYRPAAEYVGNYCGKIGCVYEPVSERKHAASS
jgi:2-methylcitrate synthase